MTPLHIIRTKAFPKTHLYLYSNSSVSPQPKVTISPNPGHLSLVLLFVQYPPPPEMLWKLRVNDSSQTVARAYCPKSQSCLLEMTLQFSPSSAFICAPHSQRVLFPGNDRDFPRLMQIGSLTKGEEEGEGEGGKKGRWRDGERRVERAISSWSAGDSAPRTAQAGRFSTTDSSM